MKPVGICIRKILAYKNILYDKSDIERVCKTEKRSNKSTGGKKRERERAEGNGRDIERALREEGEM